MSQPKQPISQFNTGWQNIKSWAKQQNIPDTAVNNVYALDQQRISSGSYAMSNAERTRAILAAAGQNYNTALPTDAPSASDVLGNTVRNVQAIGSGLMPNRLVSNIWDTLKVSLGDVKDIPRALATGKMPDNLSKGSLGADLGALLTGTAASWAPGAWVIGTVLNADPSLTGDEGFKAIAKDPVSSILDVFPVGHALDLGVGSAVAKSSIGKALADKTGIAQGALARTGALRLGGVAAGTIQIGKKHAALYDAMGKPVLDAAGIPRYGVRTLAQRATDRATSLGSGKLLSMVAHSVGETLPQKGHIFDLKTKDLVAKVSKVTPDKMGKDGTVIHGTHAQWNDLVNSGLLKSDLSPTSDLMKDPSIPRDVKEAVQVYGEWVAWAQEVKVAAGDIVSTTVPVTRADGTVVDVTALYESSSGVFPARAKADAAQAKLDTAAVTHDALLDQARDLDALLAPKIESIAKTKTSVNGVMAASGPYNVAKMKMFGRLAGRDGLLDQVDTAFKAQDWVALRKATTDSLKVFKNKTAQGWMNVSDLAALKTNLESTLAYAKARATTATKIQRAYYGLPKTRGEPGHSGSQKASVATLTTKAEKAHKEFLAYVKAHPSGDWANVQKREFEKAFLASDKAEILMDLQAAGLKDSMRAT